MFFCHAILRVCVCVWGLGCCALVRVCVCVSVVCQCFCMSLKPITRQSISCNPFVGPTLINLIYKCSFSEIIICNKLHFSLLVRWAKYACKISACYKRLLRRSMRSCWQERDSEQGRYGTDMAQSSY